MNLLTYLTNLGLVVPEKETNVRCSCDGANSMHDQWANIEVPEVKPLNRNEIFHILANYLDSPSQINGILSEICSLQPTVKVPNEIETLAIEYYKWHELNKDNPAMLCSFPGNSDISEQCVATMKEYFKSQEALFTSIRTYLISGGTK